VKMKRHYKCRWNVWTENMLIEDYMLHQKSIEPTGRIQPRN
jgi:hypothetical protein